MASPSLPLGSNWPTHSNCGLAATFNSGLAELSFFMLTAQNYSKNMTILPQQSCASHNTHKSPATVKRVCLNFLKVIGHWENGYWVLLLTCVAKNHKCLTSQYSTTHVPLPFIYLVCMHQFHSEILQRKEGETEGGKEGERKRERGGEK